MRQTFPDWDSSLAAQDIRLPALQLLAQAEKLTAEGHDSQPLQAIARHLLSLADDLQDRAAEACPEAGAIEPERVALAPLLRDTADTVSALVGGRRRWRIAAALDEVVLRADRRALNQVVQRVLTNAVRFSSDGDWIDIDADQGDRYLAIRVQDEGHTAISAVGAQADRRGLGLGLVLSRRLMRAHGGTLSVARAPAVGTCVTLTFPADLVLADV